MATTPEISTKRIAIGKANAQMVAIVAIASFITVFSLVAAKTVFVQNNYQSRVTTAKSKAHQQLLKNITAAGQLVTSYDQFVGQTTNVIGGSSTGSGDNDGDNARIVLDALPQSYDFPALASSLEKILTQRNYKIGSISGTDDQVNQQANLSSPNPMAVPMNFSISVTDANYTSIQQLITTLQSSIRPIVIDTVTLSGGASNMQISVTAHTFYQPAKNLQIKQQVVK